MYDYIYKVSLLAKLQKKLYFNLFLAYPKKVRQYTPVIYLEALYERVLILERVLKFKPFLRLDN